MEIAGSRCFAVKSAIRLASGPSKSGDDSCTSARDPPLIPASSAWSSSSGASDLEDLQLDPELISRRLDRCQLPRPGRRIHQHCDAAGRRDRLSDQLQPFASQAGLIEEASRDVPTRLRETADKPGLHRVALQVERDDRNRAGCILRGPDGGRAARKDHVDLSPDEISGETGKRLVLHAGEPDVERYRLALDDSRGRADPVAWYRPSSDRGPAPELRTPTTSILPAGCAPAASGPARAPASQVSRKRRRSTLGWWGRRRSGVNVEHEAAASHLATVRRGGREPEGSLTGRRRHVAWAPRCERGGKPGPCG